MRKPNGQRPTTRRQRWLLAAAVPLTLFIAVGLALSGPLASGGRVAFASSTTITVISGPVEVSRNGGDFAAVEDGAVIGPGHTVRTGAGGRAVLTYFEGSTVTVEPGTELTIDAASGSPDGSTTISMTQHIGRTWHVVTRLLTGGSRYDVKTPASTASVRGTAFEVGVQVVDGVTVTTVDTTEGSVVASNAAATGDVVVPAGFATTVRADAPNAPPPPPVQKPEAERKVTVTVDEPNSLIVDPFGRANGMKDGKLVIQTPGAQVSMQDGRLVVTLPNMPDGRIAAVSRGGDEVPLETTVQERGEAPVTVVGSTRAASGGVSVGAVDVRRAPGSDRIREVTEAEREALPAPKVGDAPVADQHPAPPAIFRPGASTPSPTRPAGGDEGVAADPEKDKDKPADAAPTPGRAPVRLGGGAAATATPTPRVPELAAPTPIRTTPQPTPAPTPAPTPSPERGGGRPSPTAETPTRAPALPAPPTPAIVPPAVSDPPRVVPPALPLPTDDKDKNKQQTGSSDKR